MKYVNKKQNSFSVFIKYFPKSLKREKGDCIFCLTMLHYKVRSIYEKQTVKSWVREKGKQVEKGRVCMIYTVTLNPSLDYTMKLEKFRSGSLNRAAS